MFVAKSSDIANIDSFLCQSERITMRELMLRSAYAIKRVLLSLCNEGDRIVVLAGPGNNGGDGYALASICEEFDITVFDVLGRGQRSEEGAYYLSSFASSGGKVVRYLPTEECKQAILSADCIVDAVFGVGFKGEYPDLLRGLVSVIKESRARKIAVDIPLGVDADTGEVDEAFVYTAYATVCLSMLKAGLISQPARSFCGKVILDSLGADAELLYGKLGFQTQYMDRALARSLLPRREENSNKSSFGRLAMITGSDKYRGAAHLSLEGALRGGVGYVYFYGDEGLCTELRMKLPEAIYISDFSLSNNFSGFVNASCTYTAVLIGSGVGSSLQLYSLIDRLVGIEGAPLVLDADAINSISEFSDASFFKKSKREIIITPHPLELSRLMGKSVESIQASRIRSAEEFVRQGGERVTLVLKGSSTVIASKKGIIINSTGSSALAKAGTGDVLAGLLSSLVAMGTEPLIASALAVYYHGKAGDELEKKYSPFGVLPSDLPREIAGVIAEDYK